MLQRNGAQCKCDKLKDSSTVLSEKSTATCTYINKAMRSRNTFHADVVQNSSKIYKRVGIIWILQYSCNYWLFRKEQANQQSNETLRCVHVSTRKQKLQSSLGEHNLANNKIKLFSNTSSLSISTLQYNIV